MSDMDTLTFSSSGPSSRFVPPIEVDWCGETIQVHRPKQAIRMYAATIDGNDVPMEDRAAGLLAWLMGSLAHMDYRRFLERAQDLDDPLNLSGTLSLVTSLESRWQVDDDEQIDTSPIVLTDESEHQRESVRIVNDNVDLDVTMHRPKDVVTMIVAACTSTRADVGQIAWGIGFWLDASLDTREARQMDRRWRAHDDPLDIDHLLEPVRELIERWKPTAPNRAERRASAKGSSSGGGSRAKSSGSRSQTASGAARQR